VPVVIFRSLDPSNGALPIDWKLHARIANIRKDVTHKATTALAKGLRRIGIEDLNVQGMVRNRRLARSIMDGGF
jgi:putative transposase